MSETDLLLELLRGEHAAVYGYAVLGARLDTHARAQALADVDAHRVRRDDLAARLRARDVQPPGPAASYDVAVDSPAQAQALAVRLEEALAVRWRALVGGTSQPGLRRLGVEGLQGAAVRAARWRRASGLRPGTVALPGGQDQLSTSSSSPASPGSSASGTTS